MTVGWGVIGCGGIANHRAIPEGIVPAENAILRGVADVVRERAVSTAEKFRVAAYADTEELLADPQVDAVYLPVPPSERANLAKQAARAGKHVLCEKPMAYNAPQCEEMIRVCKEKHVLLGVGFMMRFHACHRRMRELIEGGAIGRPVAVHVRYHLWSPPRDSWYQDKAIAGGGPLTNQGSHGIDTACMLVGPIRQVASFADSLTHDYEVEDTDTLLVRFANGAHGVLEFFASVPNFRGRRILEVLGSEGTLRAEETMGQLPTGTLWHQRKADGGREESSPERVEFVPVNMYQAEIEAFSEAVETGRPFEIPGEQGLHVQRVMDGAYQSAAEGRVVDIDASQG